MLQLLLQSFKVTLILIFLTGIVYPGFVTLFGQLFFYDKANGEIIFNDKKQIIGCKNIGQAFTKLKYFIGRPSRAGSGYDALFSGGSNLGPTSQKLFYGAKDFAGVNDLAQHYRRFNDLSESTPIPVDAVTASASGLDSDISYQNALLQSFRIAKVRNIKINEVKKLIDDSLIKRDWGFLGEPRVNVLLLNMSLDKLP